MSPSTISPSRSDLELQESLASQPTGINADGTVQIHIIRPTVGRGLGKHKYTAEMLEANADVFTGWKMYIDHQSPEARKAAGGLPRSIRDLGGRILESHWDPTVPAAGRFGQGAVVGTVKPVGQVKRLIEEDPELLEASIRAKATDVHQDTDNGEQVWVVEGINRNPPGSVDWVSEGGAGGRVADLLEGLATDESETAEGGTVKDLEEALSDPNSDASKAVRDIVAERTSAAIAKQEERHKKELAEAVATAKEEGLEEGRKEAGELSEAAKAEAEAGERKVALRDMRDEAHSLIEAAKLPSKFEAKLKGEFDIVDDTPTAKLDVETSDVLTESVQTDIREARELLAEVAPARVEGQGPTGADGDTPPSKPADKPFYEQFLVEAGIDPEQAFGNSNKEIS